MIQKNRLKMAQNRNKIGETILISEELFRLYSIVSRHTPLDKCYPFIELAQNYYLEPILGTPLLFELQMQVADGNVTELNQGLLLKIAPFLSAWTDFLAIRTYSYSTTARGVTKDHSENSEALNEKELGFYIHNLRETANQQQELLVRYLCRCADSFPLWRPDSDCECAKYVEESNGTADPDWRKLIYFPSGRRSGCPKCDRD